MAKLRPSGGYRDLRSFQITTIVCPKCGKPMALRTAQKGARAGKQFWGCSGYPECKGLVDI